VQIANVGAASALAKAFGVERLPFSAVSRLVTHPCHVEGGVPINRDYYFRSVARDARCAMLLSIRNSLNR
jgi:hypothetical protein